MNIAVKFGEWLLNTDFEYYDDTVSGSIYKSKKYPERKTMKEIFDIFIKEIDYDPHESSFVKCDLCNHKWVAVRPEGLTELECPNCRNIASFENI